MLFEQQLSRIEQKVDLLMAAQDDVNAAVTALTSFLTDLSNDVAAISAQLQAGGGTPVDTSSLNAVIAQLPAVQSAIGSLANPPAPTPAPAPVTAGGEVPEPAGPAAGPVTS